jgi:DNA-binding CsgD family transcriptional regulator
MALSVVLGAILIVDKRHQRDKSRMKQKQERALSEKDNQLSEITEKSQSEISKLKNEKLEAELRHKNSELASSTMNLIQKNEFITGIKGKITTVIKKERNQEVKSILQRITKDIEKNLSNEKDWEHFEYHFDRVHGDFLKRIQGEFKSLTAQEIKLASYLRLNLSTKEIAQLLNISVRGVEISRYRLRKKLNLPREVNLQKFILDY